jgi:hypothetical protein
MRIRDGNVTQGLSTDEAYERFFDGYYNLGRPDEIFGRNVVMSRPKADVFKVPGRPTNCRIARSKRLAGYAGTVK